MPTMTDPADPKVLVDLRLPPDPSSPARARLALNPLENRFDEETLFKLRLLVSELVTNSVRHARLEEGDLIWVRILCGRRALRVEVLDSGWGFPTPRTALPYAGWELQRAEQERDWPGGWGLNLVETLADSWGIVRDDGTTVWFEVNVAGSCRP